MPPGYLSPDVPNRGRLSRTAEDDVAMTGLRAATLSQARLSLTALTGQFRTWLADRSDNSLVQRVAGTAFLIRVASAALVYLTQVLLARWMGSFEFGIYVYVWTWVLLVGALVDFGLASSAQRFIPEYTERKALALLRGFLSGSRWLTVAIATAMAGLSALGIWLCGSRISRYEVFPLYLACFSLPFFALTHMQEGIARSYNWINLALLPPYILRSMILVGVMGAAHWSGLASNSATAIGAAVVATWVTAIVQLVVLDRKLARRIEVGPRSYDVKTWFATAVPIFMVEGFYSLLTYTDVLVLQQYVPPDQVAIYYAAAKTLALVAFVYYSVAHAAAHKFTEYHVNGDRERLSAFLAESIRWTFWPSLAATIFILVVGQPILRLFGPQFVAGYPLMFILAAGLLARSAVGPVERLLNMVGEQRACALVYAAAFGLNLATCIVLIPPMGVTGAAIATAAGVVTESILLFWVTKVRLGLHVFIWRPAKYR
jgi:O-antigen/teichoic acid export membrane protein